jgi:hypothetical protein
MLKVHTHTQNELHDDEVELHAKWTENRFLSFSSLSSLVCLFPPLSLNVNGSAKRRRHSLHVSFIFFFLLLLLIV